jgi:RHS repeat-associated protein
MPHLPVIQWDFKDQLSASSRQVVNAGQPETTYYVYDAGGQRARKVTERANGARKNQRIYVGGFEVYREYEGIAADAVGERETLHVVDDKKRIALVDSKTVENGIAVNAPVPVQRYQLSKHLGSASLELDRDGGLISYEEYHPYGTTSYQAISSASEVSLKRYRYTAKERDEETGLYYHGARYYAPWLGRWTSCDPAGTQGHPNIYVYGNLNPVRYFDPDGMDETDSTAATIGRAASWYGGFLAGGAVGVAENIPNVQAAVMLYKGAKAAVSSDKISDVPANVYNNTVGAVVSEVKKGYQQGGVVGAVYEASPVKTAVEGYGNAIQSFTEGKGFEGGFATGRNLAAGARGAADTIAIAHGEASRFTAGEAPPPEPAPPAKPAPPKVQTGIKAGSTVGSAGGVGGEPPLTGPTTGAETAASSAAQARRLKSDLAAQHVAGAERSGTGGELLNDATKASGLKSDPSHRMASYLTPEEIAKGTVTPILGGDGVRRTLVQVPDQYFNGQEGVVEYIIDQNGAITHQRFMPGGVVGAGPNGRVAPGL